MRQLRPAITGRVRDAGSDLPDADAEFIGRSVREMRLARELTLQQLSDMTDLSMGFLSQVERGLSRPSINAARSIAEALGVTIGWFFQAPGQAEGKEGCHIVRAKSRRKLAFESGMTDELLSPHLGGELETLLCRIPPGATSGPEPYAHRGEEAGLVLEGELELWIDGHRFLLGTGDSFGFPSLTPHRYRNPGRRETVVVWVITPPTY